MNDLEKKIDNVSIFVPSQTNRLQLQEKAQSDLFSFLSSYIERLSQKDAILNTVETELLRRIQDEGANVSTTTLIRVLEIFKREDNLAAASVLNILRENTGAKVVINNNPEDRGNATKNVSSDFNAEETDKTKKLLDFLEKIDLKSVSISNSDEEKIIDVSDLNQINEMPEEIKTDTIKTTNTTGTIETIDITKAPKEVNIEETKEEKTQTLEN